MADEEQRLIHAGLGSKCLAAQLNLHAAEAEQVFQRLGLTAADLAEPHLSAVVLDPLLSLQLLAGVNTHTREYAPQEQHPLCTVPCLTGNRHLGLSDFSAALHSPTPAVQQQDRGHRPVHGADADKGGLNPTQYSVPWHQLHVQQAEQLGGWPCPIHAHAAMPAVTRSCRCSVQHELSDWHMVSCRDMQQGPSAAGSECVACQQPCKQQQLWYCQPGAIYAAAGRQQQGTRTQLQHPTCGWHSPGLAASPFVQQQDPFSPCRSGLPCLPPQTAGLTQLQPGSKVVMVCKGLSGAYRCRRSLLIDALLGKGAHAEIWRVRELLAAEQLQGPAQKQAPPQHDDLARNTELFHHSWHNIMSTSWHTKAAPTAGGDVLGLMQLGAKAGGKLDITVVGNAAPGAGCLQQGLHFHPDTEYCFKVSEHCMALKVALRHDCVKPKPKQSPERYYQLQQQAMSEEFCTMWAAKQQGKLAHITECFDYGDMVYADRLIVPCILMEYAAAGSLKQLLLEQATAAGGQLVTVPKGLSSQESWHVVGQIAAGLADLHSMGVMHRDVKCANCVGMVCNTAAPNNCTGLEALNLRKVLAGSKETWHAPGLAGSTPDTAGEAATDMQQLAQVQWKLCDFGTSRYIAGPTDLVTETVGTRIYRPAEMDNGGAYSLQVDTYMLGLLYLELRFGHFPFCYLWLADNLSDQDIKDRIPHELDTPDCPYILGMASGSNHSINNGLRFAAPLNPEEKRFVKHCLTADPTQRPTAAELLELYPQLRGER